MICPVCNAEYREGYTRCLECDARLVEPIRLSSEASAAAKAPPKPSPPVVVWRGQDPVAFSAVVSALADANIQYFEFHNRDFTACLSRPMTLAFYGIGHIEVRVYPSDVEAAQEVVEAALQPIAHVYTREELDEAAESAEAQWDAAPEPGRLDTSPAALEAGPDKSPVEVWRGRDPDRAQSLAQTLGAENITAWVLTASTGDARLLVAPEQQDRANQVLAFAAASGRS